MGREKRGNIAFEVPDEDNSYNLIFKPDLWASEMKYIELGKIAKSGNVSGEIIVDSVDYSWYGSFTGGSINYVNIRVSNTGEMAFVPKYNISIWTEGTFRPFYSKKVGPLWLMGSWILPGETETHTEYVFVIIDKPVTYRIKVFLEDENGSTLSGYTYILSIPH